MTRVASRNSFWITDLNIIKEAKNNHNPNYASLIRTKIKEYNDNADFILHIIEMCGTQSFYWHLPDCILSVPENMKLAVLADSKSLKFIPEKKLSEDIILQAIEGDNLENLFVIPHVTKKLTFSLCHLALKKQPELCLMTFFQTEPKFEVDLSKEEKQILYSQLTVAFKQLDKKLPPYLSKYEEISSKLTPEIIDKMVAVLKLKDKLTINLPEKIDKIKLLKI